MSKNPVVWFEIYADDLKRARTFYESVLGVKLEEMRSPDADLEMLTFPMTQNGEGAGGALARMKGFKAGGSGTLVYFRCEDCAKEASRVAPAGGRVHKGKTSIGQYGFMALAVDTEGNIFGLHSQK
ncbi:MAG: VOC family protein [Bryobacterales bacterium]|nr:VOC family protein [Bryobacterales bacterium]